MAIERMRMMNLVGLKENMDRILRDLLQLNVCEFVQAQENIENNEFALSLDSDENLSRAIELNTVEPFSNEDEDGFKKDLVPELMEFYGLEALDKEEVDRMDISKDYGPILKKMEKIRDDMDQMEKSLGLLGEIETNRALFNDLDADLSDLAHLENFSVRFGLLSQDGRYRVKKNYGNILAIFYHTGSLKDKEIYLAIYPKEVDHEISRILKSLNWEDLDILGQDQPISKDIILNLNEEIKELERQYDLTKEEKEDFLENHREEMKEALAFLLLEDKIRDVKAYMVQSPHYFFLSAWVGVSDIPKVDALKEKYPNLYIDYLDPDEGSKPPTKLKNNRFFRPFEALIHMYGTPNYYEFDPTMLFGITYMILFGAMFGDVGQGAVFLLAGLALTPKIGDFGRLLKRIGLSSMVFGCLYGSVFGSEELITGLWFKPFNEINRTLVTAIVFGLILLFIAYILGIYNQVKAGDKAQAFFSKEGFLGVFIFLNIINLVVNTATSYQVLPSGVSFFFIILALVLMLFQGPIVERLTHKKQVYSKVDYYTESFFGLLETLLSTVTGIISFIRVGAFAINHVGLFLAFQTLGKMIGSTGGNIVVLILGNIVIIGLEGLIVFIQSLRLEYYELFSRFYKGNGRLFHADGISLEED